MSDPAPALLPIADAQARLLTMATPVAAQAVPLREAAGRWASVDVRALRTQPGTDLSAMDGYAIRWTDRAGPWSVIGESAAGRSFGGTVAAGEAIRIFTGAAMPDGADTVLVQEEARRDGATLYLGGEGPRRAGGNVRRRGLDFAAGEVLVAAGERLTAARIAVAATGGHATLPVRRPVRVAIAATGDELRPLGSPVDDLTLPESNSHLLAALLAGWPVELIDLGILRDDLATLRDAFAGAAADVIVTTGGASVGDHDLVRPALEAAGGTIDFWRIALRPGKPMLAGRLGDTMVLGLPGNPVSVFVTATLFLKPLIAHLSGAADPLPRTTRAVLGETLPANGARTDYLRGSLVGGRILTAAIQDSSMLRTLARADCLVVRQPHAPAAGEGDSAEILMIA